MLQHPRAFSKPPISGDPPEIATAKPARAGEAGPPRPKID